MTSEFIQFKHLFTDALKAANPFRVRWAKTEEMLHFVAWNHATIFKNMALEDLADTIHGNKIKLYCTTANDVNTWLDNYLANNDWDRIKQDINDFLNSKYYASVYTT